MPYLLTVKIWFNRFQEFKGRTRLEFGSVFHSFRIRVRIDLDIDYFAMVTSAEFAVPGIGCSHDAQA